MFRRIDVRRAGPPVFCSLIVVLVGTIVFSAGATLLAAQPPPTAAQEGFVPVDQLPPDEQLPAAPLLIAAYAVAWLAVFGYLWSIWQRLARVERDIAEVSRRIDAGTRR